MQEICSDPQFYTGGASRFDVSQGLLGDCWLVAAIASLTQDQLLLKQVRERGRERGREREREGERGREREGCYICKCTALVWQL